MNEDFVPFELAKKLKEKGLEQSPIYFNYSSYYKWDGLRKIHPLCNASVWFDPHISKDDIYFAPTISQVLKWLREEKKIHIEISPQWQYMVYDMRRNPWIGCSDMQNYDDYTKASIAGIEYVLDNLI